MLSFLESAMSRKLFLGAISNVQRTFLERSYTNLQKG
jgi:hypothetical protein